MKCVVDSNILIDLNNGNILARLFELPLDITAPDAVLDELVEPSRSALYQLGLHSITLTSAQVIEAALLQASDPRISLGDASALTAAQYEGALLLTGDKRLRDKAAAVSLPTHGVLWVLDLLEDAGLLHSTELATSLRLMLDAGARLPAEECKTRFQRWSGEA